jgi:translation initiation factor 2 subunit 2
VQVIGRQTYVKNFNEIAKVLRRDSKHMAKFLFKELAAPGSLGNELILQGKFSSDIINKRVEDYVKEFVYCHECRKPDTNLVKSGRVVFLKCEACGARRSVKHV